MIRLVVALDCEAKPLLKHYRLKRDHSADGFRIYCNSSMALIVAGMGRVAAAAASAYLQAFLNEHGQHAWLNIGIGGRYNACLGDGFIAHKISEAGGRHCWYPPLIIEPACASAEIMTVDRPESDYSGDVIYEMEAAGFYPTACRFSTAELVQVLKIISDNHQHPLNRLTTDIIAQLVGDQLALIQNVITQVDELARELIGLSTDPIHYRECLANWHFTASERHKLRDRLQRWQLLCPQEQFPQATFTQAKEVLYWLEQRLADKLTMIVSRS
jgi:hypothetical protein